MTTFILVLLGALSGTVSTRVEPKPPMPEIPRTLPPNVHRVPPEPPPPERAKVRVVHAHY